MAQRRRFNDISRLISANQGQGQRVANAAIGSAQSVSDEAQNQYNQAQQQYNQAVSAGTPAATIKPQQAQPPKVTGSGPIAQAANGGRSGGLVNSGVAPNLQGAAQAQATAVYKGPTSIADTQGVNNAALQGSLSRVGDVAKNLTVAPSKLSGQSGAFESFLANRESGDSLRAAQSRFNQLRTRMSQGITSTAAADAAKDATSKNAAAAQAYLDDQRAQEANAADQAAKDQAAKEAQQYDDEDAMSQFVTLAGDPMSANLFEGHAHNIMNGTIDGRSYADYFAQNKDAIKNLLRSHRARSQGITYGISGEDLLRDSGYDAQGAKIDPRSDPKTYAKYLARSMANRRLGDLSSLGYFGTRLP